ncbi:hypothetical protein L484_006582 [Morus notabilis]|uniref:Uncharacterized protein n=1 Tax=Morus notabilis TaxID=981085 RepID=W9SX35_9ROSA|nr:hypothetical protein L484_006582 [Morus notabilis]
MSQQRTTRDGATRSGIFDGSLTHRRQQFVNFRLGREGSSDRRRRNYGERGRGRQK